MRTPTKFLPDRFLFTIGGFGRDTLQVEFAGGELYFRAGPDGELPLQERVIAKPAKNRWRAFWRSIEKAGVWNWDADYLTPGVTDGADWSLEMRLDKRTVISSGSNGYAGGDGPNYSRNSSFAKFLCALTRLTGVAELG